MQLALYIILALLVLGVIAAGFGRYHYRHSPEEEDPVKKVLDMECCGQHEVCEKDSLLAAVSKEIEYYNDEELDRYRGTASSDYTDEAVDEFREVLYTMKEYEVAGWVRSLQLRAVELPDALKDEVFLIIGERRK